MTDNQKSELYNLYFNLKVLKKLKKYNKNNCNQINILQVRDNVKFIFQQLDKKQVPLKTQNNVIYNINRPFKQVIR